MMRVIFAFLLLCFSANAVFAQQTREELEKQRQQLKKEIEETQKQLNSVNVQKSQSISKYILLSNKVNLQDRVVENIGKDIHILDDNIYVIQKDINRYDRLLDTLKQEYAKSMVYSYKNRGNYEFLNFIFSADNFNDAVKRISYLKSYRTYREMQGENILRTQELRKKRLVDLGVSKEKKSSAMEVQSKEMAELQTQKTEQDKVVTDLKKQGKDLNARIAAKQKEVAKVNAAVKAAIAAAIRAQEKARADALAAAREKAKADALAGKVNAGKPASPVRVPVKGNTTVTAPENKILNDESENIVLSNSFRNNQGHLPWPVDNGAVLMHFGPNYLRSGSKIVNDATTISSAIGTSVKAVFDGTVIMVAEIDEDKDAVTIKHGEYYTTYSNLANVSVKKDQEVKTGQSLGRVAPNLDGIGSIDFYCAKGLTNYDPEKWLRRR